MTIPRSNPHTEVPLPSEGRASLRVYLWASIAAGALALLLLAGFAVYLFTRNLEIARQASRERMNNLAAYIVEHVETDLFSYTLVLTPETLPPAFVQEKSAWLAKLARATGLQRVALTDSLGRLYVASESTLASGSIITRQVADSTCFEAAAQTGQPVFCGRKQGGITLQSLYHPFDFFGNRHLIVLESDSNFLTYLEQYRTFILAVSAFLACILAGLLAALILIERKARIALSLSRRNEQLAFLGRASAELAHELKNPLAIIKASVDVLRRQMDVERKNQAFNFLSDEVMRLSRLISNILGLSRDRQLDLRSLQPADSVLPAVQATREIYPDITVDVQIESGLQIVGDADALRQILENLLRNAAQAMEGRGHCHVVLKSTATQVEIDVADQGPGIAPELRASLFDPFVSGNKAGTGLGLAIVRNLVERMGWRMSLLHDAAAATAVGQAEVNTCFRLECDIK